MNATTNLTLPLLLPAQAQKHVTHNEALEVLDILVQLSVRDDQRTTPPEAPSDGDRYIVGRDSTGPWSGYDHQIAAFIDGVWSFSVPQTGWRAWCETNETLLIFDGSGWINLFGHAPSSSSTSAPASGPANLLGVNAMPDDTNRFAVSSPAALFNHEGSDHRLFINKASRPDTGSIVFQTGFNAHGEIGLTGNNDLTVKVGTTANGLAQALTFRAQTGFAGFGTSVPRTPLHIVSESHPQIRLQPRGYSSDIVSQPSVLDFWSTFDAFPNDQGPRRTASVRAAFDGGAWGTETLSFHVGGSFDAAGTPAEQMRITAAGNVGIGVTRPSADLHVNGAVRVGHYTSASLPNPVTLGPGAIIFATDAPLGPGLVVSDGTNWIR